MGGRQFEDQTIENGFNLVSVNWKKESTIHSGQKKDIIEKMYPGVQPNKVLSPSYLNDDTSEEKRKWLESEENKYTQTKIAFDRNQKLCIPCCYIKPNQGWDKCKIGEDEMSLQEKNDSLSLKSEKGAEDFKNPKYIMTNDSRTYPTPPGRYSMLPSDLHKILNKNKNVHQKVLKENESGFVRMGTLNHDFISVIFEMIKYPKLNDGTSIPNVNFGQGNLKSTLDFRNYLAYRLDKSDDNRLLKTLKNGDIFNMFDNFSDFLRSKETPNSMLNDHLLIDLLSRPEILHLFGLNIIIFEVDKEKDKSWIKCPIGENFETLYSKDRKTITLINYDGDKYEPIVHLEVKSSKLKTVSFISEENQPSYKELIFKLTDHIIKSCSQLQVSTNIQMLNGPSLNQFFSKLRNYLDLPLFLRAIAVDTYNKLFGFVLDIKQSNELQIKLFGKESQLENVFVVFPIRRQGIPPPSYNYNSTQKFKDLPLVVIDSINQQFINEIEYSNQINFLKLISDLPGILPIRKILDDSNTQIVAIITGSNEIIPVRRVNNYDDNIPVEEHFKFYEFINESIVKNIVNNDPNLLRIRQELYKKEIYQRLRYELAQILVENRQIYKQLKEILPIAEMNHKDAILQVNDIVKNIINEFTEIDIELSIYNNKFSQPTVRERCSKKDEVNCNKDVYCTFKNSKCLLKVSSKKLLNKFIQNLINELIINRIRRAEILDNQVDYIINSGQYITTKPQYELIEKVDILSVIMSMFDSEKFKTNIYGIKERILEDRVDGVKKDINIQIFENRSKIESDIDLLSSEESSVSSIEKSPTDSSKSYSIKKVSPKISKSISPEEKEKKKDKITRLPTSVVRKVVARVQPVVKKVIRLKETKSIIRSGDSINFQIFFQNPDSPSIFLHYIDNKAGYEQPFTQIRVKEIRKKIGAGLGSKAIIPGPWEKFIIRKVLGPERDNLVSGDSVRLYTKLETDNYLCVSTQNNKLVLKNSGLCKNENSSIFTIRSKYESQPIRDGDIIELVNSDGTIIFSNIDNPKLNDSSNYPSVQNKNW